MTQEKKSETLGLLVWCPGTKDIDGVVLLEFTFSSNVLSAVAVTKGNNKSKFTNLRCRICSKTLLGSGGKRAGR